MVLRSLWVFCIAREKDAGLAIALNAAGGVLLGLCGALSEKCLVFINNSTLELRFQIHTEFAFLKLHVSSLLLQGGFAEGKLKLTKVGTCNVCFPQMCIGKLCLKAQYCLSAYWEKIWRQQCFMQVNFLVFDSWF